MTATGPRPVAEMQSGPMLRKAGRNDEAVQRYRELIAVDPNNASTHNSLGLVLEQRDPDAAIVGVRRRWL